MIWAIIIGSLFVLFNMFSGVSNQRSQVELPYSDFIHMLDSSQVSNVTIRGTNLTGQLSDGRVFHTYDERDRDLIERLSKNNVDFRSQPTEDGGFWSFILHSFPTLILIAIWIFALRQMSGAGKGGAMSFGRSKAKKAPENVKVKFDDVAGVEEAKQDLTEVVDFLKNPKKYQKLGGRIPRGVLLVGPPGTGKTMLAKAVSGEAGVPFFSISGSEFVEMFVGVGASRVRDMFANARKHAPCIIFIDEIDAVGRQRGSGHGGGNDEREQTLNQLLVEMDGFDDSETTIVIAATNRSDVLDKALMRPGRFDRQVMVDLPDLKGREKILEVHLRKVPISKNVDVKVVARGTPGFSGADLANLVNEAALLSARNNQKVVMAENFDEARDKILMGPERKNQIMSDTEVKNTAYHEAGHALVAYMLRDNADPIHKATILPRGRALGMVQQLPERDVVSRSLAHLKNELAILMGGRVAEEIIGGKENVTTGASSDIKEATRIARNMVVNYGLSDELGPIHYDLEAYMTGGAPVSTEVHNKIDTKIRQLVDEGFQTAQKILKTNQISFEAVAQSLLKYETLTGEEISRVIEGKEIRASVKQDTEVEKDASDQDNATENQPKKSRTTRKKDSPSVDSI